MSKCIRAGILIGCLVFAGGAANVAGADSEFARMRPYASLGVAVAHYTDKPEKLLREPGSSDDVDVIAAVGADLRIGVRIHKYLSTELQLQRFPKTRVERDGLKLFEVDAWSLTGNAKGHFTTGRLQPFVLVGVGQLHARVKDISATDEVTGSDNSIAVRFAGGIDLNLNDYLALTVEFGGLVPTGDLKRLQQFNFATAIQTRF